MSQKHYKKELNLFVDRELPKERQQEIAEHLMQCVDCRSVHDRIKLGTSLANQLDRYDAPARIWNKIENELNGQRSPQVSLMPAMRFGLPNLVGYAVGLLVVAGLVSLVYFALFRKDVNEARKDVNPPIQVENVNSPMPEIAAVPVSPPMISGDSNSNTLPASANSAEQPVVQSPDLASLPSWQVETLSGTPKVGDASDAKRLAVGEFLETDAASRARITVANIGNVEIQPNSRVKLVGTNAKEHRLSLEHGILQAQISAPPRLFIVDTPSAVAVDLGCAYKLEVDKKGNSYLHVTSGFVALERDGRESIVPAGAMCITKRGLGLGTPFSADTTDKFKAALERFDFSNGGSRSVQAMLDNRGFYDMISLWHLLSRVQKADREKVFDALADYVKPPSDVTREGILTLDKQMLTAWRAEVEKVWFE